MSFEERIAENLLSRGLVSESKLVAILGAAEKAGISLEEAAVLSGIVGSEAFNRLKAELASVPPADLSGRSIDPECLDVLPAKLRRHYQAVPFDKYGNNVKIAMVRPWDFEAHEALEAYARRYGWKFKYYSLALSDFLILAAGGKTAEKSAEAGSESSFDPILDDPAVFIDRGGHDHAGKSLDRLLKLIVSYAVDGGAIKIHLEESNGLGRVRFRRGGRLYSSLAYPAPVHRGLIERLVGLSAKGQGRSRLVLGNDEYCLISEIVPLERGHKAVIEPLNLSRPPASLRLLGFSQAQSRQIGESLARPGIILISADNDADRQAALYALLNEYHPDEAVIATIEERIAHRLPSVCQCTASHYNDDRGRLLAAMLEQDADVVMSDELTSASQLEMAVMGARRGKTLILGVRAHTLAGALETLWRQSDGDAGFIKCLNLAMQARGAKKLCRHCVQKSQVPVQLKQIARQALNLANQEFFGSDWPGLSFYRGAGCDHCHGSGYKGRALLSEIWPADEPYRFELAESLRLSGHAVSPSPDKYATILQDGIIKATYGLISLEEAVSSY